MGGRGNRAGEIRRLGTLGHDREGTAISRLLGKELWCWHSEKSGRVKCTPAGGRALSVKGGDSESLRIYACTFVSYFWYIKILEVPCEKKNQGCHNIFVLSKWQAEVSLHWNGEYWERSYFVREGLPQPRWFLLRRLSWYPFELCKIMSWALGKRSGSRFILSLQK
jgi:hypothetical protein